MDNTLILNMKISGRLIKSYTFADQDLMIGRDPSNRIALDDVKVSRSHTKIFLTDKDYFVEDLQSTNGTYVNGKRIKKERKLKSGDILRIGSKNIFEVVIKQKHTIEQEEPVQDYSGKAEEEFQPIFQESIQGKGKEEPVQKSNKEDLPEPEKPVPPLVTEINQNEKASIPKVSEKKPRKQLNWKMVTVIAMGFFLVVCVLPFVIIEVTNQWCNLFAGFFNSLSPGICP